MPIEVKNISCRYGEKTPLEVQALQNISFRVEDGAFVGIMGHTGCGKSTLIQLIAGLLTPAEGQILIDGEDINGPGYDREVLRRTLGIVFQYPEYQLFETTVEKEVAFALKHRDLSKTEKAERVRWALEAVGFRREAQKEEKITHRQEDSQEKAGLGYGNRAMESSFRKESAFQKESISGKQDRSGREEIARKSPLSLSGGEKRRVAIASVLAARPRILIFDEPIAGLDPVGRQDFLELAAGLNRQGTTILMVSHDADSLCEYADRILVLDGGRLAADGSPKEIFADADQAEKLQIGTGTVRHIAGMLYAKGVLPNSGITKYNELIDEIKKNLKAGENP